MQVLLKTLGWIGSHTHFEHTNVDAKVFSESSNLLPWVRKYFSTCCERSNIVWQTLEDPTAPQIVPRWVDEWHLVHTTKKCKYFFTFLILVRNQQCPEIESNHLTLNAILGQIIQIAFNFPGCRHASSTCASSRASLWFTMCLGGLGGSRDCRLLGWYVLDKCTELRAKFKLY